MESCSSWEKLNIKTRKPYTITKQRERWTEDEHNSFLEALKLYGRAWQRIEEHVGTKTAVQIRSHAQKFFTKLEKEAVAKGVPIGQALDLEIPPPRPKRKPNHPYPRKTHTREAEKLATSVSALPLLDLESKPLPEKTSHSENLENEKTSVETQNGIEGPQEAPCASLSLGNAKSVPNESFNTIETSAHFEHENIIQGQYSDNPMNLINDIIHAKQTYPRHVPVQIVGVHEEDRVPIETSFHESKVNKLGEVHEHPNSPNLFVNVAAASASSGQNHNDALKSYTIPAFHPLLTPFSDNQENYISFLHAASFAAKFWHPVNAEACSADYFSRDQLNNETTPPSMAAIAAATVAAATAWWSTHGLLPVCTPFFPGGYSCTFVTPLDGNQARVDSVEREKAPTEGVLQEEKMDAENTESPSNLSSSDEPEKELNIKETASVVELHDPNKTNVGKQIDRSSCGSNTTSSSEIEMDVLEKHGKETEENKGSDVKESFSRRVRSTISPNESWKGVSEEGRVAFHALFSREVLPQSFSNNPTVSVTGQQNINKNTELDPNQMSQEPRESNGSVGEEGVLRMGLGSVKVNAHRTGFRPYKRCSVESSKIVSAASTGDEKGPKRICMGTEASS